MKFKENLVEIMKLEKVAVLCDTEEKARALLDELDKYDVCWCDYERIGSYTYWDRFKENTCYIIHNDRLNYGAKDVYTSLDRRIIEFEELLEEENSIISHPAHYCYGKYEPKDVIRDWGLNFNLGNVIKYITRAGHKDNIVQDLKKARQYLDFEIEALEKERAE